ncbi:MAG: diaminopimelate decarboxylase [Bacilli bacterium]|nr:diaminopimelate decarboxylase [Bacilli bacterium]
MFYLHGTSRINDLGHLEIGGCDTTELVSQYGSPLFVYDETYIRQIIRSYRNGFDNSGLQYEVAYASKAFCTQAICRLVEEEGGSLDVVSMGELYTALSASFPAERIHFHGNNKTPEELEYALDAGIGAFVIDNFHEMQLLGALCRQRGIFAKVLLRVTPGVDAHTHDYISTGQQDSKFGFDVSNETAHRAIEQALQTEGIQLIGLHSHIGSSIFITEGFALAIERVSRLYEWAVNSAGANLSVLNVGGGFGIRYQEGDTPLAPEQYIEAIASAVKHSFDQHGLPLPKVVIEPGRSIVGAAGTTLYTIGSKKVIPGVRTYLAVDGGMTDNPRPALYQAKYEAAVASRMLEEPVETVSIAGKCCESGDMLIWDVAIPHAEAGDILAVSCTGAYNYSMASNYNRIGRPAVVFVSGGEAEEVVRRESLDDLVRLDRIPARMQTPSLQK